MTNPEDRPSVHELLKTIAGGLKDLASGITDNVRRALRGQR